MEYNRILKIHLSVEKQGYHVDEIDYTNENTDVIVEFEGGDIYVGAFFTYKNLETKRMEYQNTNEFLGGKYFWVERMVFVDEITKDRIEEVVVHLIDEGDFQNVFRKLQL